MPGNSEKSHVLATKVLAEHVATARQTTLLTVVAEKIKEVIVDYIGVVLGALEHCDSSKPIYEAILALQGGAITSKKSCTVIGKGTPHFLPQYAALLNSAFGHSLDFDDTYTEGTIHAGVTVISAALTQAELLGSVATTADLMLAISIGYEINCRLARELGYEAYHRGFHNTSTAGIFGAVAAIAVLRKLSAMEIEMAWGLAGSKAAGSMQYLDNGSWNKRLHPGFAVHDAFMCVALVEHGVIGATNIIEGSAGFLQAYSPNSDKDLERLVRGFGEEWVWLNSSLKPYSACRMTHGFIELAGNIRDKYLESRGRAPEPDDVDRITLSLSHFNYLLVGQATDNKIHPQNVIDAQFSAYYQVANALLYGSNTGLETYTKLDDRSISILSDKIKVEVDEKAFRGYPAHIRITWKNGSEEEHHQEHPLGESQHPFTKDKVAEKYLSLAEPLAGKQRATEILEVVYRLERHKVEDLVRLIQL